MGNVCFVLEKQTLNEIQILLNIVLFWSLIFGFFWKICVLKSRCFPLLLEAFAESDEKKAMNLCILPKQNQKCVLDDALKCVNAIQKSVKMFNFCFC